MKIRIKGNAVRIRLSKTEVELFALQGYIEETTDFEESVFRYTVKRTAEENMSADFANGNIILYVSKHLVELWSSTSLVGIVYDHPISNGKFLNLLLEKDFKCIDAIITEDQSDYFENPAKSC
jgi:hypothetical protein